MPTDPTSWLVELWRPGVRPLELERLEGPLVREHRLRAVVCGLAAGLTVTPLAPGASRLEAQVRPLERAAEVYLSLRPASAEAGELLLPEGPLAADGPAVVALPAAGTFVAAVGEAGVDFRAPEPGPFGNGVVPDYARVGLEATWRVVLHFVQLPRCAPESLVRVARERVRDLAASCPERLSSSNANSA